MKNKKKLIKEQEEEATEDKQSTRAIEGLNDEFKRYLVRLGWNNPNIRNEFISTVNSYILSGENSSVQQMITTYLQKGLEVLNIELNKQDILTKQSVTKVEPEDVDDENEINENLKNVIRKNKIRKQRQIQSINNISEIRKGLIDKGYNLVESGTTLKNILNSKDKNKYLNTISKYLKEDSEKVDDKKVDVYLNNFNTFLKMYLESEYDWSTDPFQVLSSSITSLIDKGAKSSKTQTQIVLKINDLLKLLSKNFSGFNSSPTESKNLDVASSELRKYAVIINGWSQKDFNNFYNDILKMAVNSKNVNVQRKIAQKLSDIDGSISKPKPKQEPKKDKEVNVEEKPKQEPKPDPKKQDQPKRSDSGGGD